MSNTKVEPIFSELMSHCTALESVTDKQIVGLKRDQEELSQKIEELSNKLTDISKAIPADHIGECGETIEDLCDRLEKCWARVLSVNKRADKLIQILGTQEPSLQKQIQNRISQLITKENK